MYVPRRRLLFVAFAAVLGIPLALHAATKTATFRVQATVQSDCTINATNLDFGNVSAATGALSTNVDAASQITITCTPNAAYSIMLNAGDVTGSTIADRKMSNGAQQLSYQLYSDAARSQLWGDGSAGSSAVGGTGNGTSQTLPVYGRIPPQTLPPVGNYLSNVTATITY